MSSQISNSYNPNPGQQFSGSAADGNGNGSSDQNEKLLKEIQDKIDFNRTRLQGNESNIKILEKDIKETGVWAKVSGHKAALQKELEADKQFRQTLLKQQTQLEQTLKQTQQLIAKGKGDEASKFAKEREEQRKDSLKLGSDRYLGGLKEANKDMQKAGDALEKTEKYLKTAQRVTVVAGAVVATAATGGAGAGFLVTALAGTGGGTGIAILTNGTENIGHVMVGNKDGWTATKDFGIQTGKDFLTSAQIGISGGAGGSAANGLRSFLTEGGKQALTKGGMLGVGMTAGGTSGLTSSVLQTGTNLAMGTEERTLGQIAWDTGTNTVVGTLSGGLGAKGQSILEQGTNSVAKTLLVKGATEVVAPTLLSTGSNYAVTKLTGRDAPSGEQLVNDTGMAILSSWVGANAASNHQSGRTIKQEFTEMPTFAAAGKSITGLFTKQTPPAPKTLIPAVTGGALASATGTNTEPAPTEGKRWPTKIEPEDLPQEIQNDNSFQAANRGDKKLVIFEDPNLPENVGGLAGDRTIDPKSGKKVRVMLEEGTVDAMNDPTHPNHEQAMKAFHEEVAHAHQAKLNPENYSKEEFVARSLFKELAAKSTAEIKTAKSKAEIEAIKEKNERNLKSVYESIKRGAFNDAIDYAKESPLMGKSGDWYENYYGKGYEDYIQNRETGNGEFEIGSPRVNAEESGTAVLDRPGRTGGRTRPELLTRDQQDMADLLSEALESCKGHKKIVAKINEGMNDAKNNHSPVRFEKDAKDFLKSRGYSPGEIDEIIDGAKNQEPGNGKLTAKNTETENPQPKSQPEQSNGNGKPKLSSNEQTAQEISDRLLAQFLEDEGNSANRVAFESNDVELLEMGVRPIDESQAGVTGQLPTMTCKITDIFDTLAKGNNSKRDLIKGILDPANGLDEFGKNLGQLEKLSELSKKGVEVPEEMSSKLHDPSTNHFIDKANEYHSLSISGDRRKLIDDLCKKHFGDTDYDARIEIFKLLEEDAKPARIETDTARRKEVILESNKKFVKQLNDILDGSFMKSPERKSQAIDLLKARTALNDQDAKQFLNDLNTLEGAKVKDVEKLFNKVLKNKDAIVDANNDEDPISGAYSEATVATGLVNNRNHKYRVIRVCVEDDGKGNPLIEKAAGGRKISREYDIEMMGTDGTIYLVEAKATGHALYEKNFYEDSGRPKDYPQAVALVKIAQAKGGKTKPVIAIDRPSKETGQFRDEVIKVRQLVFDRTGYKLPIFDKYGNDITSYYPIPQD